MDYRAKEKTWLGQMDQVFGDVATATQQPIDRKWEDLCVSIQSLLIKRTKLWWNRAFLERYISNKLIPRGLRVKVIPAFPVDDEMFVTNWEEACSNCSGVFMQLLIGLNTKTISDLDKSIDLAQTELKTGCPAEKIQTFNHELEKLLDSTVKKIHESQTSKFNRDVRDFRNKSVYQWRKQSPNSTQIMRTSSHTSISSLSDQSDAPSMSMVTRSGVSNKKQSDYTFHPYRRRDPSPIEYRRKDNKVINLSHHTLSKTDLSLLSKGLSFSPVMGFDTFTAIKDLHIFARSLLFKRHFYDDSLHQLFPTEEEQAALRILEDLSIEHNLPEGGKIPPSIRPHSKKFPPLSSCTNIDLFVQLVTKDFLKIPHFKRYDNLTREERNRLNALQKMPDVVIKPADKGGNIVIWPKTMYEKEAFRQLNDKTCYRKLTYNPLSAFCSKLDTILKKAITNEIITKDLALALMVHEPTISTLYLLPKLHKNINAPPGRPIISGRGNYLENVGRWIDSVLQPLVCNLPSYLKDTSEFLRKIDGLSIESDSAFVTIDVESLYTNIKHSDGLRAVGYFLDMSPSFKLASRALTPPGICFELYFCYAVMSIVCTSPLYNL
ncbi:unnamed protein product [Ranitomeya imitator]|uniref:Reverse transcriptase domain-containing protein n=1 Tax=Ranitomeya imitator TaxID=111125 RepID=A0ABN9MGZ1_9NEOB|nr:unnamed protein product [Ranitomeya imitator]